jgi:hypothetical protein
MWALGNTNKNEQEMFRSASRAVKQRGLRRAVVLHVRDWHETEGLIARQKNEKNENMERAIYETVLEQFFFSTMETAARL